MAYVDARRVHASGWSGLEQGSIPWCRPSVLCSQAWPSTGSMGECERVVRGGTRFGRFGLRRGRLRRSI
eukprot:10599364-Alexandrium_andersonii.AAC.1